MPAMKEKTNLSVNTFDYSKTPNPAEALGRSQVYFTGNIPDEKYNDEIFLSNIKKIYRFDDKQAQDFNQFFNSCLKQQGCNSVKDLNKNDDALNYLLKKVQSRYQLDYEEMVAFAAEVTTAAEGEYYNIQDDEYNYSDDYAFDSIAEKYNIDDQDAQFIRNYLKAKADFYRCENYLDLLNERKKANVKNVFVELLNIMPLPNEDAQNFVLDLSIAAKQSIPQRIAAYGGVKETKNYYISEGIAKEFNLSEDIAEEIEIMLDKNNVGYKDIDKYAFLIADRYNLPSKAEDKIKTVMEKFLSMSAYEVDNYYEDDEEELAGNQNQEIRFT